MCIRVRQDDRRHEFSRAYRPLGQSSTYALHFLYIFIEGSEDTRYGMLRRTDMPVASRSGDVKGEFCISVFDKIAKTGSKSSDKNVQKISVCRSSIDEQKMFIQVSSTIDRSGATIR